MCWFGNYMWIFRAGKLELIVTSLWLEISIVWWLYMFSFENFWLRLLNCIYKLTNIYCISWLMNKNSKQMNENCTSSEKGLHLTMRYWLRRKYGFWCLYFIIKFLFAFQKENYIINCSLQFLGFSFKHWKIIFHFDLI